jgi:dienelactone hydrolase
MSGSRRPMATATERCTSRPVLARGRGCWFSPTRAEQSALLEAALTDAGVEHTIEFYPARHGFAVPDNPTFDNQASERHWAALGSLYQARLNEL